MEFIDKKRLPSWRDKIVLKNKNAEKLNNFVESLSRGGKKGARKKLDGTMWGEMGVAWNSRTVQIQLGSTTSLYFFTSMVAASEIYVIRIGFTVEWSKRFYFNMSLIFMNANSKKIQWEMHLISGCEDLGMLRFLSSGEKTERFWRYYNG